MVASDLTPDLGVLTPATSLDGADRRSSRQEAERKSRQRARPEHRDEDENENQKEREQEAEDLAFEPDSNPPHQLNHLA
jgi:hypothetical protein